MISASILALSSPYQRLQGFLIGKKWARWLFSQNGLNFFVIHVLSKHGRKQIVSNRKKARALQCFLLSELVSVVE